MPPGKAVLVNGASGTLGLGVVLLALGLGATNIGEVAEMLPMNINHLMNSNQTFIGSVWFTTGEGQEMADMARVGTLDMGVFSQHPVPLDKVDTLLAGIENRHGGFSNFTICP